MFNKKKLTEGEKNQKREKIKNIIGVIILSSFSIPIVFLISKIASLDVGSIESDARTRGDYILMLIQCILGIIALIIPNIIAKKKKIQIPTKMYILYMIFLYCAIFLGEVRSFYYIIPHWDTILHTFSGMMMGALGYSFISMLNKTENIHLKLEPFFVAAFAFMFSVTLGVIWEVYEYTFDGLLNLNMQKFYNAENSVMLVRKSSSGGHNERPDGRYDWCIGCQCGRIYFLKIQKRLDRKIFNQETK